MDSILTTIKSHLGPTAQYEVFNDQIIDHINTVFADLEQIGVGPPEGFSIEDDTATWDEFISVDNTKQFETVKSYMGLRVKLLFDPPSNSTILASMERQVEKAEARLSYAAECMKSES